MLNQRYGEIEGAKNIGYRKPCAPSIRLYIQTVDRHVF